ncbi:fimbrial protein [Citrobacter braakii]|uniref:fimbrial protein n=1 Tax=Citrobacter braakii TaxID=57706 RepID=UPI00351D8783
MNINNCNIQASIRWVFLGVTIIFTCLISSGMARADGCTGWGGDTERNLDITIGDLSIPSSSALTSTNWSEIMNGTSAATALLCTDSNDLSIINTNWYWLFGSSSDNQWTRSSNTSGIGLKFTVVNSNGTQIPIDATDGFKMTGGLDWASLQWGLVRMPENIDISKPIFSSGPLAKAVLTLSDGSTRTLTIRNTTSPRIIPECTVDAITPVEFGNVSLLSFPSVGDVGPEKTFRVGVTCPNGILTSSMMLSLSAAQTDSVDSTLIGNSGTASGIGVEVLDNNGQRVNVNSSVYGGGFLTSTSQTWGVRFVRTGSMSAGTVRAIATINVTVA